MNKKLLKQIEKIWKKNSGLRFCQLIQNMFGTDDIYHITDEDLELKLKDYYEEK